MGISWRRWQCSLFSFYFTVSLILMIKINHLHFKFVGFQILKCVKQTCYPLNFQSSKQSFLVEIEPFYQAINLRKVGGGPDFLYLQLIFLSYGLVIKLIPDLLRLHTMPLTSKRLSIAAKQ